MTGSVYEHLASEISALPVSLGASCLRAWESGQWARFTLDGRVTKPRPSNLDQSILPTSLRGRLDLRAPCTVKAPEPAGQWSRTSWEPFPTVSLRRVKQRCSAWQQGFL